MRLTVFLYFVCLFSSMAQSRTEVSISGEKFLINGVPTFEGQTWNGYKIEGLLPNSRMVQAIFEDLNPETKDLWKLPNGEPFDPEKNTNEFIAAMEEWRNHGLLAFTINLQGGSPQGYSKDQPWINSAIAPDGTLRPVYMKRLKKILDKADTLGMVAIVGIFYFGQDERIQSEHAVIWAVENTVNWLHDYKYKNVLIEINNECNIKYDHEILKPERVHELIERAKSIERNGRRYLVSTSYGGGTIPKQNVVKVSDFILLHGNGVNDPNRIKEMVEQTRKVEGYTPKPIVFNEDDHFDFDKPLNNFVAATSVYASWGFFDYRKEGEAFNEGYQSMPTDWTISSERKKGFFDLLQEMTQK